MATGFLHGNSGGAALNMKLVGGLTRPANPRENTIWVNTSVPIPGWSIGKAGAADAESREGFVAIVAETAAYSPDDRSFNVLRKNGLWLKLISAKQLVSDSRMNVELQIYQDGAWHPIVADTALYLNGVFADGYTHTASVTPSTAKIQYDAGYITISTVAGKACEVYEVFGPLSLKGYSSVSADFKSGSSVNIYGCILIADGLDADRSSALAKTEENIAGGASATLSLDLTGLDSDSDLYMYAGYTTNGNAWENARNNLRILAVRLEA